MPLGILAPSETNTPAIPGPMIHAHNPNDHAFTTQQNTSMGLGGPRGVRVRPVEPDNPFFDLTADEGK